MTLDKRLVGAIGLCLVTGCSSSGDPGNAPDPKGTTGPSVSASADYENQVVTLSSDLVIPAGKTVHVGPGVTFEAATGVKIQVEGTLEVDATDASPTIFTGSSVDAPAPNAWQGIEVESGGNLVVTHVDIEGAEYGIHAMAGSAYKVDYAVFGTSFKPAVLEADGSFDHSTFHATTPPTIALTVSVTIDDPNGTMTIIDASPTISNSLFDGSTPFTDMVRVGGNSIPVFDHVHLTGAHCAFHTSGATNNSPLVKNSIIENMSYGVMAFTAKPVFENTNFLNNTSDIGFCYGATADNAPVLNGNYFLAGDASFDASCVQVGTTAAGTVSAPIDGAGPVGL
ncbi:MAG TPA: hypothetical protein VH062_32230 [Polyangiaceae bacterium]|nr:hypothetical protein [Polyangiaceae bacterium]